MKKRPYFAYRSFWKELETRKAFAARGIREFCVFPGNSTNSLGEPYSEYPPVWRWFDSYDFSSLDRQMEDILAIAPDARFLFMIDLNSPLWLARHLGVRREAADSFPNLTGCLASEVWKKYTTAYLKALIEYAQKKYADQIECFILACGTTDEWMDYSTGAETEEKFACYCEWAKNNHLPEPEEIPNFRHRFASPHEDVFRDPVENADALQYWKFHSDLVADGILHFASEVRPLLNENQELGCFYGYVMELTKNRMVQCGHLGYEKILESGLIDFFISPGDYHDRAMGGGGGFMNLNGSIHLHDRHYLHEIDHLTHTGNMELTEFVKLTWMHAWPDTRADIAGLRREFCRSLLHGTSLWWFDMWGKYFVETETLDALGQMAELWEKYADRDREPDAEIAVIVDPASIIYLNDHQSTPLNEIFVRTQTACNHLGMPYALYDISDIGKWKKIPKLALLPLWVELTPEKQELLRRFLPDTELLWIGPAAQTDGRIWAEIPVRGRKIALEELEAEILRAAAVSAGVHVYTEERLPLWTDGELLSAHSAESRTVSFHLKRPAARIVELFSGKEVAVGTADFSWNFNGPETVLFALEK